MLRRPPRSPRTDPLFPYTTRFRSYIEADMYGGGSSNLGNEVSTNTHGLTLRQAFVTWNNWLAGQAWSNFQDVAALPEAVDFVGVTEGPTFVRQAQIRYTNGPFSVALENTHTTPGQIGRTACRERVLQYV